LQTLSLLASSPHPCRLAIAAVLVSAMNLFEICMHTSMY
jgi:hypothetical protein